MMFTETGPGDKGLKGNGGGGQRGKGTRGRVTNRAASYSMILVVMFKA